VPVYRIYFGNLFIAIYAKHDKSESFLTYLMKVYIIQVVCVLLRFYHNHDIFSVTKYSNLSAFFKLFILKYKKYVMKQDCHYNTK